MDSGQVNVWVSRKQPCFAEACKGNTTTPPYFPSGPIRARQISWCTSCLQASYPQSVKCFGCKQICLLEQSMWLVNSQGPSYSPHSSSKYLSLGKRYLQGNFGSYIIKLIPSPLCCCVLPQSSLPQSTWTSCLLRLWSRGLQWLCHCSPENQWPWLKLNLP